MGQRVRDLIEKCGASRPDRQKRYGALTQWYLQGTDAREPARFNKLQAHGDLLTSYLYAPDATRFLLSLPVEQREKWQTQTDLARDVFVHQWRQSGADVLFASIVEWGLVWGCTILKLLPSPLGASIAMISPGDFGVLREDCPALDAQDVIVHWFSLTVPEVERLVEGLPEAAAIVDFARQSSSPREGGAAPLPALLSDVIVSSVQAGTITGITSLQSSDGGVPIVEEPLVELAEVWEKTYEKLRPTHWVERWEVSTVLGEYTVVPPRENPVLPYLSADLPGELPFVALVPSPLPTYFWGRSDIAGLLRLQQWREDLMAKIDTFIGKRLNPPRFFSGLNMPDDKLKVLDSAGGFVSSPMPNARMDVLTSELPAEAFHEVDRVDAMFGEAAGLPPILAGANVEGVRAGTQVGQLATIAVGRIRKRALLIEDALETLTTRMFHLMQRLDPTEYPVPGGSTFLLSHLPGITTVKVSAHTSSPVYAEQTVQKAQLLLKAGAIDLPTFVELVDPPMMETLREKSRVLQDRKAKIAQEMLEIQKAKAMRGRGR